MSNNKSGMKITRTKVAPNSFEQQMLNQQMYHLQPQQPVQQAVQPAHPQQLGQQQQIYYPQIYQTQQPVQQQPGQQQPVQQPPDLKIQSQRSMEENTKILAQIMSAEIFKAKCRNCQTVLESTNSSQFIKCKCGKVGIDGGKSKQRRRLTGLLDDVDIA